MKKGKGVKQFPGRRVSIGSVTTSRGISSRQSYLRIYLLVLMALATLAVVCGPAYYSSRVSAQNSHARLQQDLEQVFANHEDVTLDPQAVAARVRDTGRMSLKTRSNDFALQLRPNDLRASNYHAEEVGADGISRSVEMPGVITYKGNVEGVWASDARFTVKDDQIEGLIVTPNESYYLESAQKYSATAQSTDYLIYKASDVRPEITRSCADTLNEKVNANAQELMSSAATDLAPAAFSPFKIAEIATEADFEYTSALGGSAAANSDILSIMNQVQAIYERDIGLTFTVTFQHTWATPNDPYSASGDAAAVLREFTNYWNANFAGSRGDLAHMWTGRDLGGSAGVAWTGVVCWSPLNSYGVSDRETIAPFRVGIPAHEIGHNFNASHSDGQAGCDNTIMVAIQDQSNMLTFCQFSIGEITTFINTNSGCLGTAPAGNPIDQTDFFVRQHYSDFLGRTADQQGLDFWSRQITDCGSDAGCIEVRRISVSASFFLSIEFKETGYLVERTYKTAYGDANGNSTFPGTHTISVPVVRFSEFLTDTHDIGNGVIVGQTGWEQALENNKMNYFNRFVQTTRFTSRYPSTMLPASYVHALNVNAGSPLLPTEEAQLAVEQTSGSKSRAQVLRQIAEHPNLANAEFNRAFVLMQYFGYLRRNPNDTPDLDYTGYDFWL
ncbi:MAG TPA: M12 family metallo-peptidase, partial [Pyrinomonadaceae bacterium]|nr:M12 family metallo-peptidase [Pyrinomonadaceae bacterium]